jgi:hypothetical protein
MDFFPGSRLFCKTIFSFNFYIIFCRGSGPFSLLKKLNFEVRTSRKCAFFLRMINIPFMVHE